MSDQNANLKGYSYQEMSSKVERADRSLLRSRAHEPTGEVESLRGRTDVGRMGDRISGEGQQKHARPSELLRDQQKKKKAKKQQPSEDYHGRRVDNIAVSSTGQSILELDNLTGYQPTTQTARAAYETILVRRCFGSHRLETYYFHRSVCVSFSLLSLFFHFFILSSTFSLALYIYIYTYSNELRPQSVQRCFWATSPPLC